MAGGTLAHKLSQWCAPSILYIPCIIRLIVIIDYKAYNQELVASINKEILVQCLQSLRST